MAHIDLMTGFSNWTETHTKFLIGILINIVLIWVVCKIIDIFNQRFLIKLRAKVADYPLITLMPLLFQTLKFVIAFLLIAGFLQSFGYNVNSIVAGFGITGLAVAFAAQTTIGNLFGSFSILTDKVFKIGDFIKFNDLAGRVEGINLRSTQLRTIEGFLVNVPNNVLANTSITNATQTSKYRVEVVVAIECDTELPMIRKAKELIYEVVNTAESIEKDSIIVFVESVENTAINVKLFCYTTQVDWREYVQQKSYIIEEIIGKFQAAGISLDIPDSRLSIVPERDLPGVYKQDAKSE